MNTHELNIPDAHDLFINSSFYPETAQAAPYVLSADSRIFTDTWLGNAGVLCQNPQKSSEAVIIADNLRCFLSAVRHFFHDFHGQVWLNRCFADVFEWFYDITPVKCLSYIGLYETAPKLASREPTTVINSKKHPVLSTYKDADSLSARREKHLFVIEGGRLVRRAVDDRLFVESLLYTGKSPLIADGYIHKAADARIPCYPIEEGLMGTITTSRPIPSEIALCRALDPDFRTLALGKAVTFLITDNLENPDNLGLIIRTADAFGADAVFVTGQGASPYHKNCVRASRGAMGRMPISEISEDILFAQLEQRGFTVWGTSAHAKHTLYGAPVSDKRAVIVGSETYGMRPEIAARCGQMFRIPMALGQSSFNVAVAAGLVLNEFSARSSYIQ